MNTKNIAEFSIWREASLGRLDLAVPFTYSKGGYSGRYNVHCPAAPDALSTINIGWVIKDSDGTWCAYASRAWEDQYEGRHVGYGFRTRQDAADELVWDVARNHSFTGPLAAWVDAAADTATQQTDRA